MKLNSKNFGAIILAGGKGKRMKAKEKNKVVFQLADKPLVLHTVQTLEKLNLGAIVVVVGYAKESVKSALSGRDIIYAEQTKRLGTGHAALCGLRVIPKEIDNVLMFYGDDSAFYTAEILTELINLHLTSKAALTFLTITVENPFGLGRIVRDQDGKVLAIVEEKDATEAQREIKEINPACYIFSVDFLKKYLPRIPKSPVTGEYYLTHLIDMAISNNEVISDFKGGPLAWRGVNTPEELEEAEKLFLSKQ